MYLPARFLFIFVSIAGTEGLGILDDDMQCDIIKIGNIIRNKVSPSCCTLLLL